MDRRAFLSRVSQGAATAAALKVLPVASTKPTRDIRPSSVRASVSEWIEGERRFFMFDFHIGTGEYALPRIELGQRVRMDAAPYGGPCFEGVVIAVDDDTIWHMQTITGVRE